MSQIERKRYFYGLEDEQIEAYMEGLGFQPCVGNYAKFCEVTINGQKRRFLYLCAGSFGMERGKTKVGQIRYPPKSCWEALRIEAGQADKILILVTYENFHAWSVNGKKKKGKKSPTNLLNWWEHCGLLAIEKDKNWKYFDCQFYTGEIVSGHYAYQAVATSLRRKIQQIFGRDTIGVAGVNVERFTQHVGIDNACTAPILYVIEAYIRGENNNPFTIRDSMQIYLDKVCTFLTENGYTGMWGYKAWEQIESTIKYRKKLRGG